MIAVARSNDEDEFDWNLPPGSGMVELAMRERRAVSSPDVLADPRVGYTPEVRARIELGTVRAGLAVPLIARGTVIGALAVGARAGRVFDAREIRLAEAFADQAAVALAGARLQEEASQAHDFLRSVVANRADAVLTTDVHGRITYFSPLAEKVCGWEAKELLGRHVSDFYKGGMDEARALMRRLRAETRVPGYRTTFRKKAGGWAEIDTCVALVRDARGAVVGTGGTAGGAAPGAPREGAPRGSPSASRRSGRRPPPPAPHPRSASSVRRLTSPCFGPTVTRTMGRLAMRRDRVSATLGTLLLLTALAAPVAAQAPIKIGEINSFSGIGAPFTGPYRQSVEMAVEEGKAKGGVLGRKLEVVFRDDKGQPAGAPKHG